MYNVCEVSVVQWRERVKNYISRISGWRPLIWTNLIKVKVKVKVKSQGHIWCAFSHAMLWTWHEVSTTNRTERIANYVIWRPLWRHCVVQNCHRAKKLYFWTQWEKTFDLIYYSTWLFEVWFFRKLWPWTILIKVKVKDQGQGHIWCALSHAMIWTLHEVSTAKRIGVIANYVIWRPLWRHCVVQNRHRAKNFIPLESVGQDL